MHFQMRQLYAAVNNSDYKFKLIDFEMIFKTSRQDIFSSIVEVAIVDLDGSLDVQSQVALDRNYSEERMVKTKTELGYEDNHDFSQGMSFEELYNLIRKYRDEDYILCTWGTYDEKVFSEQCFRHNLEPLAGDGQTLFLDVQGLFQSIFRNAKVVALAITDDYLRLPLKKLHSALFPNTDAQHHNPAQDSLMMADILNAIKASPLAAHVVHTVASKVLHEHVIWVLNKNFNSMHARNILGINQGKYFYLGSVKMVPINLPEYYTAPELLGLMGDPFALSQAPNRADNKS